MSVKKEIVYEGKAKTLYSSEDPHCLIMHFRDDTSAFNGVKLAKLPGKGCVNNYINAFIMQYLQKHGVQSHFIALLNETESSVRALKMFPIECVVRNVAAGNLSKRLGVAVGTVLTPPIFEFFLKDDALNDPMITESHIQTFGWAKAEEVAQMKALAIRVNDLLKPLFDTVGLMLVDFKLEFGLFEGDIVLADEFSPDGCRIWEKATQRILDKDRFRQDLGGVVEAYKEIAERLGIQSV